MVAKRAVIMAAGTSSRLTPLSYEKPKALLEVKGEILIERQIEQLIAAKIESIVLVTGYKAPMFQYLQDKYKITLIHNPEYKTRNNNGSLFVAKDYLADAYVCSADNYFTKNPFMDDVSDAFYAVVYADGKTDEWCVEVDQDGFISDFQIGGENAWYMLGHVFFDKAFADTFIRILTEHYDQDLYRHLLWESIYKRHITQLKMKPKYYRATDIFEFDTLDDLRRFDRSYIEDTRSPLLKALAKSLQVEEKDIRGTAPIVDQDGDVTGFSFDAKGRHYVYSYLDGACRL